MEAFEFVTAIRQRVVENDNKTYHDLLESDDSPQDSVWRAIYSIYKSLSKEQQKDFLLFLRLIQTNTISHVFGILDGSTYLNNYRESFVLKTESDNMVINGDLQDLFLEMEEM
ncbi:MAG TPA: hypothetical protein PKD16_16940 [Saprospiraceae bacterium]|jgi:hypothetical protein|nr:hypothetical protein [Saprospiraceae bacterium]HMT71857.1 hypothetical protein [Saprospiraceae bacterium]